LFVFCYSQKCKKNPIVKLSFQLPDTKKGNYL
jgi:hypothetical protein